MNCPICRKGETKQGMATVTFESQGSLFVVKSVPAKVCENCGEEFVDEGIATQLLSEAEKESKRGVQVDIREFAAL